MDERNAVAIEVPREDPDARRDTSEDYYKGKDDIFGDDAAEDENELSEEDRQLKETLRLLVTRVREGHVGIRRAALESLRNTIRGYTHSMTSVPKPLKFLRPRFADLERIYEKAAAEWGESDTSGNATGTSDAQLLADILSVLAMTFETGRKTLEYRLRGHPPGSPGTDDPGDWGHEYVQHLALEAGEAFAELQGEGKDTEPIVLLGLQLVPFFLTHNAEVDAVDLLLEIEAIERIVPLVDKETFERVCSYMVACVNLLLHPDDVRVLKTAYQIYMSFRRWTQALVVAMRLNDADLVREVFFAPTHNLNLQLQMAFILGRQRMGSAIVAPAEGLTPESFAQRGFPDVSEDWIAKIHSALFNQNLSEDLHWFAKELSVLEPKTVEDVLKSETPVLRRASEAANYANLASMYVNAFVNVAFKNDPLMSAAGSGQSFIYQFSEPASVSAATASWGLVQLWDVENGTSTINDFLFSTDTPIRAGAALAMGLVTTGISSEQDLVAVLLEEHLTDAQPLPVRIATAQALGIAYAQSSHSALTDNLSAATGTALATPSLFDNKAALNQELELECNALLSIGLLHLGTADGDVGFSIMSWLMEARPEMLDSRHIRFALLGLGLIYLGQMDKADAAIEALRVIEHPIGPCASLMVSVCAHAGTGNVHQVQDLLGRAVETLDDFLALSTPEDADETKQEDSKQEDTQGGGGSGGGGGASAAAAAASSTLPLPTNKDSATPKDAPPPANPFYDLYQSIIVIGIALVAIGEDIGAQMAHRQFSHLMRYGEPAIRRTVPLAIALLSASNPQLSLLDSLSKFSHDADIKVARNAIFAMGIVGAGSNNARLAQMLRSLATYYQKDPPSLFVVRVAQGILHLGKGTVGIAPHNTDRALLSPSAVAGLLIPLFAFADADSFIFDKQHHYLYYLTLAMHPRFLVTLDTEGKRLPVDVRVGQAVDTTGQAGKPRTVSGFQTHSTPVRLAANERAELATNKFVPFSHILENVVILADNTLYDAELDEN